jgi:hypothetical protein
MEQFLIKLVRAGKKSARNRRRPLLPVTKIPPKGMVSKPNIGKSGRLGSDPGRQKIILSASCNCLSSFVFPVIVPNAPLVGVEFGAPQFG